VRELEFRNAEISSHNLGLLLSCRKLQRLNLFDTDVDDAGIQRLVSHPSLKSLNLTGTLITEACVPSLNQMPSLQVVNLSWTQVPDVEYFGMDTVRDSCPFGGGQVVKFLKIGPGCVYLAGEGRSAAS
jgi:hypothetical protein